jgi:hypothetical protein
MLRPQKVCNLTLNSFSGTHRHTLGGGARGSTHRGVIFIVCAAHEVFKGVNLIDHVSLEDRLRVQGYGSVWLGGEYELH